MTKPTGLARSSRSTSSSMASESANRLVRQSRLASKHLNCAHSSGNFGISGAKMSRSAASSTRASSLRSSINRARSLISATAIQGLACDGGSQVCLSSAASSAVLANSPQVMRSAQQAATTADRASRESTEAEDRSNALTAAACAKAEFFIGPPPRNKTKGPPPGRQPREVNRSSGPWSGAWGCRCGGRVPVAITVLPGAANTNDTDQSVSRKYALPRK